MRKITKIGLYLLVVVFSDVACAWVAPRMRKSKIGPFTYLSDGTFTIPAGVTSVTVKLWGGGGGAGQTGISGGGGGYASKYFSVSVGQIINISVGQGGAAGSCSGGGGVGGLGTFAAGGSGGNKGVTGTSGSGLRTGGLGGTGDGGSGSGANGGAGKDGGGGGGGGDDSGTGKGGGGGGSTQVKLAGTEQAYAGGGGGGGGQKSASGGAGGAGCSLVGSNATSSSRSGGGGGGGACSGNVTQNGSGVNPGNSSEASTSPPVTTGTLTGSIISGQGGSGTNCVSSSGKAGKVILYVGY